jgi:hypothetical protein
MQTKVCTKLGISFSDIANNDLYSLTEIKQALNDAQQWARTYKKWSLLESTGSDLIDATGNYPYPTGMATKSAFLITVAGYRYEKVRYEDYLKYFEDQSTGTDKIWAEYGRTIYINGNACSVGNAVVIYGQKTIADMSADADTSFFSAGEPSGDEAIVLKAVADLLDKEKTKQGESKIKLNEAMVILEQIWSRITENNPREVLKNTPRFKKINVITGTSALTDPNDVGRFHY